MKPEEVKQLTPFEQAVILLLEKMLKELASILKAVRVDE